MPLDNVPERGIERLKKKLYEREGGDFSVRRSDLDPLYKGVNRDWKNESEEAKKPGDVWLKILLFSFLFFVAALGVAFYVFFRGTNVVSDKNIEMSIVDPTSIKAGDELNLQIGITNRNTTAINQAELISVFPAGTREVAAETKELTFQSQTIGQIKSGETVNLSSKALIYGKENDILEIKFTLRYRLDGSNTLFEKEVVYRLEINASPIELSVVMPAEVNSSQEINAEIHLTANAGSPLSNILLSVSFPPGFVLKSAEPAPNNAVTANKNTWFLGDLPAGIERVIKFKGTIDGLEEEIKSFEVKVGMVNNLADKNIAFLYNDVFKTIAIKKSFIGLTLTEGSMDQAKTGFVLSGVETKRYIFHWINNLSVKLENLRLTAKLSGEILNQSTVAAGQGYYSSVDNTITWNKNVIAEMLNVDAGARNDLEFQLAAKPLIKPDGTVYKNPQINISAIITGTRTSEGFDHEDISTNLNKTIKVDSLIKLKSQTWQRTGPFTNTGPVPPKVNQATTYTINWNLTNTSNDITNAKVEATVPLGVSWVGLMSPSSEDVNYDDVTRKIIWNAGYLKADTGYGLGARQVSFQLSFVPTINLADQQAILLENVNFSGLDSWSESLQTFKILDPTIMSTEAGFKPGDGQVTN